jgi:hypothetical protein
MSQTNSSPDLDSAARESLIFTRLQEWDKAITSGPEIGIMCRDVRDGELWRYHEGCTSFDSWMVLAAPRARSTAYGYLRQVEALSDIPDAVLGQIRGENVEQMIHLSTAVRGDERVLDIAKTGRTEQLVAYLKENHPEQHAERVKFLKIPLSETQMAEFEQAIAKAMERGCESRSEACWMIAVDFNASDDTPPLSAMPDGRCAHA